MYLSDKVMPQDSISVFKQAIDMGVLNFLTLVFISIWAGMVRYFSQLKGKAPTFWGIALESFISGFVGVITALACASFELDFYLTAAVVGISAHNGTRSLTLIGEVITKKVKG